MRYSVFQPIGLLLAAAVGLTACGSGSDEASSTAPSRNSAPTPVESAVPLNETSASVGATATDADSITITDDRGDIVVESPATVIVTTSDEATEMVVALGIEPAGLASTRVDATASPAERFDGYFLTSDQLGDAEFVGGESLNFEAIAALSPDLIVHASDDDSIDTLAEIAPTAVFDIQVPGRWQEAVAALGDATGRTAQADELINRYVASLTDARAQIAAIAERNPSLTVIYPNYRGGDENFVFDADFALASIVPELGFDLVGIDAAEPAFPGVGVISTERYEDLAEGTDTIIAVGPGDWSTTPSGPFLESLSVPVLNLQVDEGRPSTGPLSAPIYLQRFLDALRSEYADAPLPSEGDDGEDDAGVPSGQRVVEHQYGSTEVPADPQRIVALSEEFLLSDLLALGITPVASTSNDPESFGGIDPTRTDGIELMTSATFNLEQLASFQPDLIVAYPVYIELVGYDTLNQIAPTVAIGTDDSDWRELLQLTAEVLGIDDLAAEQLADFEAQHAEAAEVLDGVRMSALSVFDPSFVRAYVDRGTFLVDVMADAGIELVPDAATVDGVDQVGRVQLSLEQFDLLQGDVLLQLQRTGIEDDAIAEIATSPLYSTLPAVQNDAVITLDRLGYPGATGAAAFVTELAAAVEALG